MTKKKGSVMVELPVAAPKPEVKSGVMFLTEGGLVNPDVLNGMNYIRLETLFDDSIDQTKLLARRFYGN